MQHHNALQVDIDQLMDGELGEWLAEQVEVRAKAKDTAKKRWLIATCIALPICAFLWFIPKLSLELKLFANAGLAGLGYFWGYSVIIKTKQAVKAGINTAIARSLGVEYSAEAEGGRSYQGAKQYRLVPGCDRESFEDRWFGAIEGHNFDLYETHLEERRGSGKNRRWVTVFRGVIMAMDFGRDFASTTLLQRKGSNKTWFGLGRQADHAEFAGHRLDLVDQVHPDFEDVFEVYSDDQVEARVLLHPTYIEHLIALERAFKGDAVRALFRPGLNGGEVVIVIKSDDLFESGSMDADQDHALAAETAQQFSAMASLAVAINQNERGRKMELDAKDFDA